MKTLVRNKIVALFAAGTITLGTFGFAAVANAQTSTPTPSPTAPPTDQSTAQATDANPTIAPNATDPATTAEALVVHVLIKQMTTDDTTLTAKTIRTSLKAGQTLAQIATANNLTITTIVSEAVTKITAHLSKWVSDGRITQAQSDQLSANLSDKLTTLMNMVNPPLLLPKAKDQATMQPTQAATAPANGTIVPGALKKAERYLIGHAANTLIAETATASNLTAQAIVDDIHNGQTLAQIAATNNADPNAIMTAASTKLTMQLQALVKRGKINQAEADQLTTMLNTTLTKLMNAPDPLLGIGAATSNQPSAPTPIATTAALAS